MRGSESDGVESPRGSAIGAGNSLCIVLLGLHWSMLEKFYRFNWNLYKIATCPGSQSLLFTY